MNDRLQQFLTAENINQAQFADSIGVARASVSHILAGRNKPGYDFIQNMLKRYPDLNVEWLLTGQGKMYKSRTKEQKASSPAQTYPVNLFDDYRDFDEPEREFQEPAAPSGSPATESITLQERNISGQEHASHPDITATGGNATIYDRAETAVRQRKAVKIVIFYDDNTFQEF